MRRRTLLTSAGALAFAGACGRFPSFRGPHRGITLDPWRARPTLADFQTLRALGASHVALFPFGYMPHYTEPEVRRFEEGHLLMDWALTDEAFLEMGRLARKARLRMVLIPTLADFLDGHWRGEVRMEDDASWDAWFDSYRDFVLHYAELAERMQAVGFSVGTELRRTVLMREQWLHTIARVRERFGGWLTYAANWDDYAQVSWWRAVDFIGVQAYFELGDPGGDPVRARRRLMDAWIPAKEGLETVSRQFDRKIFFTEVGYKSHEGSTIQPWDWELRGEVDTSLQAHAYEAAFRVFWTEPWFAGFYWWKWHPALGLSQDRSREFTPQGKEAELVLRRWYGGEGGGGGGIT